MKLTSALGVFTIGAFLLLSAEPAFAPFQGSTLSSTEAIAIGPSHTINQAPLDVYAYDATTDIGAIFRSPSETLSTGVLMRFVVGKSGDATAVASLLGDIRVIATAVDPNPLAGEMQFYVNVGDSYSQNFTIDSQGAGVDDDKTFYFGSSAEWKVEYDDAVDDQLLFITAKTGTAAITDPMYEILVGATPTADQQVFGIGKGTQASNTSLFTVDEDGDTLITGEVAAGGVTGSGKVVCVKADGNFGVCGDAPAGDGTCTCS